MTTSDETQTTPTTPEQTSFCNRKPTMLIGGGVAVAALLVGGIGIGSAMADGDDDDDRPIATQPVNNDSDSDDVPQEVGGASTYGATDAAAISGVLDTALEESNGTPTSLEANRDGSWSVDFEAANGDETTVLVGAEGSASVVRTEGADGDDANDPAPAGKLSNESIAAVVKAALAEANGPIIGIDLDDNPNEAYSVQVLTGTNAETEIDLNTKFAVTQVDVDND